MPLPFPLPLLPLCDDLAPLPFFAALSASLVFLLPSRSNDAEDLPYACAYTVQVGALTLCQRVVCNAGTVKDVLVPSEALDIDVEVGVS